MMTANDAPDSFADLAPQPAQSTSTKGPLRRARATAVLVPALWSNVRGFLARTSVTLSAFVAALWSKVRGALVRTSVSLAALVAALWWKVRSALARTSVPLAALSAALWSKVQKTLAGTSVTLAALGRLTLANLRQVITRGRSLVRQFETRWRRHRDGGIALCGSHGTVRRGRHNTLLGYPVLSHRLGEAARRSA